MWVYACFTQRPCGWTRKLSADHCIFGKRWNITNTYKLHYAVTFLAHAWPLWLHALCPTEGRMQQYKRNRVVSKNSSLSPSSPPSQRKVISHHTISQSISSPAFLQQWLLAGARNCLPYTWAWYIKHYREWKESLTEGFGFQWKSWICCNTYFPLESSQKYAQTCIQLISNLQLTRLLKLPGGGRGDLVSLASLLALNSSFLESYSRTCYKNLQVKKCIYLMGLGKVWVFIFSNPIPK